MHATSYQRRHLLLGFILDPAGHPKALEKSSLFTSVPMTLIGEGLCVRMVLIAADSGVLWVHHNYIEEAGDD